MGMSGEDREELRGIFKALSGAVATPRQPTAFYAEHLTAGHILP
jgi:hypothetical protein